MTEKWDTDLKKKSAGSDALRERAFSLKKGAYLNSFIHQMNSNLFLSATLPCPHLSTIVMEG